MKLNLDFQIKDLNGKFIDVEAGHAGKLLASALSSSNKGNAIKLMDWALKLWNKQVVELDDTDKDILKALIDSTEFMTLLAKQQILLAIKAAEEAK